MSYKRTRAAFESDQQGLVQHAPFALYGTPLPAYESDARDDGSFVPVWKQTVTDERGRKRLHGAFTGGWSAGYFNTVGSKEGWTPSTFVSSRANRAKDQKDGKPQEQRAEDFMDDEDLADQAESQKLETQTAFAGLGNGGADGGNRGMFADLFKTSGDTMGVKLLQRMGWKHGQGVGPKIRRRAKGDKEGQVHLFAPENSTMIRFIRKLDHKGLGLAGQQSLGGDAESTASGVHDDNDEDSGDDARILRTGRSKLLSKSGPLKKGAFGVGVLNDTGSDDEDPYSVGPRIKYNRVIGGSKQRKKGGIIASTTGSSITKPTQTSKKMAQRTANLAGFRKCHDGRLPLNGFALSSVPLAVLEENKYPPPQVPEGWMSTKSSTSNQDKNADFQSTADAAKSATLNPKSRAALLGEQQLPGKSIFDFISPAMRDKLAAATGKSNLPRGLGEKAPAGFEPSPSEQHRTLWDKVPTLDKEIAVAALQHGHTGSLPFASDEAKRTRYRYFLELSAGSQTNLPERPSDFSVQEWANELDEFARTAKVFKPMSGFMASRFTAASNSVKHTSNVTGTSPAEVEKTEDPAEKAARMGMYGPLTRMREDFFPTRLLCKRFNVKPPANVAVDPNMAPGANSDVSAENQRLDLVSQSSLNRMMMETNFNAPGSSARGPEEGSDPDIPTADQLQPAVVDAEKNEALEGPKAGEAIFKAIFGSDDEDE